jgi:TolA-binding protein
MLWANKKLTQSVTFTEDAADQTLLEAIEKELSLTRYQTFSNLCKQALWQFLSVSGSTPATPPKDSHIPQMSDRPFSPPPNLQHIEEGLSKLQTQLGELERHVRTPVAGGNSTEQLEKQLLQLTQQLAQFQTAITLKLDAATDAIAQIPQMSPPTPATQPGAESPPEAQPAPPPQPAAQEQTDPLLKRLSSLVDDF